MNCQRNWRPYCSGGVVADVALPLRLRVVAPAGPGVVSEFLRLTAGARDDERQQARGEERAIGARRRHFVLFPRSFRRFCLAGHARQWRRGMA